MPHLLPTVTWDHQRYSFTVAECLEAAGYVTATLGPLPSLLSLLPESWINVHQDQPGLIHRILEFIGLMVKPLLWSQAMFLSSAWLRSFHSDFYRLRDDQQVFPHCSPPASPRTCDKRDTEERGTLFGQLAALALGLQGVSSHLLVHSWHFMVLPPLLNTEETGISLVSHIKSQKFLIYNPDWR